MNSVAIVKSRRKYSRFCLHIRHFIHFSSSLYANEENILCIIPIAKKARL